MNYDQRYGSKRRLVVSLLLLFGTFFQVSCIFKKHDQPEVCKRFHSKSRTEKEFLNHSIEDQFKLHRCSLQQIPPIGYSNAMSEGGEKLVPFLVKKLNAKHKNSYERDLTILAASQVLALLAISGDLDNHRYVVPLLERKASLIKFDVDKDEVKYDLKTIKEELRKDDLEKDKERTK